MMTQKTHIKILHDPWLWGAMVLGLVLRLMFLYLFPQEYFPDAQTYLANGLHFWKTGIYTSTLHMPFYPLLTGLVGGGIPLQLLDITLSTLTISLGYMLAQRIFQNHLVARLTALGFALYPHFIFYASSRLTETSYIFLLLSAWLCLYNCRFIWASVFLTLGVLIRPTLDLFNPGLVVLFARYLHQESWLNVGKRLLQYVAVYCVLMTPWWVHNYHQYHQFVRLNVTEGFTLYSGNNPLNQTGGGVATPDKRDLDLQRFEYITDPVELNETLKREAITFIKENPRRFVELAALKFVRFWRLWPYADEYQSPLIILASLLSYGVVLVLALWFALTQTRRYLKDMIPIYALIGYLTLVHMVLIASIRYRLPLEPFLIILAAAQLQSFFQRRKSLVAC